MFKFLLCVLYMNTFFAYINKNIIHNIKPSNLRKSIHIQLNNDFKPLSYQKAKDVLHNKINFIDIYGDNSLEKNIEHIFPQSLFKNNINKNIMKADLHNLYLCNTKLNSHRQNFKYITHEDYIQNCSDKYIDTQGQHVNTNDIFKKQGYVMIINKKSKKFIPTLYSRGMISRSLAYFTIKYDIVDLLPSIIDISTLIEWNIKDPPSKEEYHKNIISYRYQNNLNPFIIDSDLILYTFSDMFDIDDTILNKKKHSFIDPLYSIDLLLNDINALEIENKALIRKNNRLLKNTKKNDSNF